jgi:hypothetical protein
MQILPSLLAGLKAVCATFPDARKGRGGNIEISDFGVSVFSMFFMQSALFLAFQRGLEKGQGRFNGQTLFAIGRIPPTIISATGWTRRISRFCSRVSNAWRRC